MGVQMSLFFSQHRPGQSITSTSLLDMPAFMSTIIMRNIINNIRIECFSLTPAGLVLYCLTVHSNLFVY